ncbi:3-deoxy-D-manno-oct-2-ulosonic acid (Kdo) hydroxylase [Methylobacterium sp. Leaf104]|uniref:Kdo hydroxylase family protein n=1 Tax=Methylobacterium TaxID=407 RepID=UPI0006FEB2EA|nr:MULTISPECIES: Kdo hydroxylase family protein [Methylobacterium]KQP33916.1 3-deoxy-D-manno-oct-2-ulosonic acid (Kdo) hydroxylase [Methylobacterium sp. Leaf104]MCI9879495.1 Kdo hydroxylase family protein [Methylobacterium goesingense]
MISPIVSVSRAGPPPGTPSLVDALESGAVLMFPDLDFPLSAFEERFVQRPFADGKAKNVNIRGAEATLRGAAGTPEEQEALRQVLIRYRGFAEALVAQHLPAYAGKVSFAGTSYRPFEVDRRKLSWRRDDTRLHVDAFPSNPIGEKRILRIFRNINPDGQPRHWRVGEDFSAMAEKFLPRLPGYSPLSARMLALLKITKARRSEYDHLMLHLHDALKQDMRYQETAPQADVHFSPGQTWVTFSDLVMHGAMGGQYMLEQTAYLAVADQARPERSPQRLLAKALGRPLR